ncbi:MAG: hypothetical protein JXA46_19305 [Dehalococcoidales bacterium]|nr:hypothetical protein [Dehalococcoidales bacterium]
MSDGDAGTSTANTQEKTEHELNKEKAEAELALLKATLDKQKLIETQQLDLVKSQSDLIGQIIPRGETKPLEGKIETNDKFGYLAEQVAYSSLKGIADKIADNLKNDEAIPSNASILIVSQLDYALGDLPLLETNIQLQYYKKTLSDQIVKFINKQPPAITTKFAPGLIIGAISAIPGAISSIADIFGYFKTDYNIKGVEFNLKQEGIAAAIAGRLRTSQRKIYLENFYMISDSVIMKGFLELYNLAIELQKQSNLKKATVIDPLNKDIANLQKEIQQLRDNKSKLNPDTQKDEIRRIEGQTDSKQQELKSRQSEIDEPKALVQEATTILSAFTDFSKVITTNSEGQVYPKLVQAILREKVKDLGITHLLYLEILASGGEAISQRNFFRSPRLSYTGGSVASYFLASVNGEIISSNTISTISSLDYKLPDLFTRGKKRIRVEDF